MVDSADRINNIYFDFFSFHYFGVENLPFAALLDGFCAKFWHLLIKSDVTHMKIVTLKMNVSMIWVKPITKLFTKKRLWLRCEQKKLKKPA